MKMTDTALVGAYVVASTLAIFLVKTHANAAFQNWKQSPGVSLDLVWLFAGALLYAISFGVWMIILARNELSVVYPLMIGLSLAATTLTAWFILSERIDGVRVLGTILIFVGILIITYTRSEK